MKGTVDLFIVRNFCADNKKTKEILSKQAQQTLNRPWHPTNQNKEKGFQPQATNSFLPERHRSSICRDFNQIVLNSRTTPVHHNKSDQQGTPSTLQDKNMRVCVLGVVVRI